MNSLFKSITVSKEIRQERLNVCFGCEFFTALGTCGMPVIGEDVEVGGKKVHLCGCVMAVKTKFKYASCDAGKWKKAQIQLGDVNTVRKIRKFLKKLDYLPSSKISSAMVMEMYSFHNQTHGSKTKNSNCTPCILQAIHELKTWSN